MILITGMPRSGTSFMGWVFQSYGQYMDPPLFTNVGFNPTFKYNFMEPGVVAGLCSTGGSKQKFLAAIAEFENHWRTSAHAHLLHDKELVIKVPQLCFFPEVCREFRKVVVCISENDERYKKSAIGHSMTSWLMVRPNFLKSLNNRTLQGLTEIWKEKAEAMIGHNPENTYIYRFGDKSTFDSVMGEFLKDQNHIDEAWQKHWRGSRF